ncbi:MAG: acyltransferase family protein [Saprospiraceae bacterium]
MKLKFRRIISAGKFIPEVDGLRFIAVFSVVMFHLNEFLNDHDKNIYVQSYDFSFINNLLSHGNLGVPLFFVLSGFILGRPFADSYINAGNKIDLKKYFIRRLTRLEPPYMLIMTFLLIAKVYLISVLTVKEGFYSYLASITYTHNFFYGKGTLPLLNGPAWSLEIEIQFYMIVPLLTHVFSIPNKVSRRLILVFASLFFIIFDYWVVLPFWSILNYFEFFLAGFLLADFYASNSMLFRKSKYDSWIGVFFLVFIWLFKTTDFNNTILKIIWEIAQLSSIFFCSTMSFFIRQSSFSETLTSQILEECVTPSTFYIFPSLVW